MLYLHRAIFSILSLLHVLLLIELTANITCGIYYEFIDIADSIGLFRIQLQGYNNILFTIKLCFDNKYAVLVTC